MKVPPCIHTMFLGGGRLGAAVPLRAPESNAMHHLNHALSRSNAPHAPLRCSLCAHGVLISVQHNAAFKGTLPTICNARCSYASMGTPVQ